MYRNILKIYRKMSKCIERYRNYVCLSRPTLRSSLSSLSKYIQKPGGGAGPVRRRPAGGPGPALNNI